MSRDKVSAVRVCEREVDEMFRDELKYKVRVLRWQLLNKGNKTSGRKQAMAVKTANSYIYSNKR